MIARRTTDLTRARRLSFKSEMEYKELTAWRRSITVCRLSEFESYGFRARRLFSQAWYRPHCMEYVLCDWVHDVQETHVHETLEGVFDSTALSTKIPEK